MRLHLSDPATGASDAVNQRGCDLFILGVFNGLQMGGAGSRGGQMVEKASGKAVCVPENLPNAIMRDKVFGSMELDSLPLEEGLIKRPSSLVESD